MPMPRSISDIRFIVPADTPGIELLRNGRIPRICAMMFGCLRTTSSASPDTFVVATRLGGGRIYHAMRTVGLVA